MTKRASLEDTIDSITREIDWTLVAILSGAALSSFPTDGDVQVVVTITKERPLPGAVATIDCRVTVAMADTVPRTVADAISKLIDQGPPAEALH